VFPRFCSEFVRFSRAEIVPSRVYPQEGAPFLRILFGVVMGGLATLFFSKISILSGRTSPSRRNPGPGCRKQRPLDPPIDSLSLSLFFFAPPSWPPVFFLLAESVPGSLSPSLREDVCLSSLCR